MTPETDPWNRRNVAARPRTRDAGRNRSFQTETPRPNSPPVNQNFQNEVTQVKSSARAGNSPQNTQSAATLENRCRFGRTWFIRCSDLYDE